MLKIILDPGKNYNYQHKLIDKINKQITFKSLK